MVLGSGWGWEADKGRRLKPSERREDFTGSYFRCIHFLPRKPSGPYVARSCHLPFSPLAHLLTVGSRRDRGVKGRGKRRYGAKTRTGMTKERRAWNRVRNGTDWRTEQGWDRGSFHLSTSHYSRFGCHDPFPAPYGYCLTATLHLQEE